MKLFNVLLRLMCLFTVDESARVYIYINARRMFIWFCLLQKELRINFPENYPSFCRELSHCVVWYTVYSVNYQELAVLPIICTQRHTNCCRLSTNRHGINNMKIYYYECDEEESSTAQQHRGRTSVVRVWLSLWEGGWNAGGEGGEVALESSAQHLGGPDAHSYRTRQDLPPTSPLRKLNLYSPMVFIRS